jgi:uncharacterized protein YqjF (DUF2071 family)
MSQNDFPYGILNQTGHRPFPMPSGPWVMTQSWHDLLFAHWPVDVRTLQPKLPPGLELDRWDGQAWLGIIPFHMTNVAARGVPALPWVSAFPELNVRTYVRLRGTPGVYFLSLDAGNPLAVSTARALFHLPYFSASMSVQAVDGGVAYDSRRHDTESEPAAWKGRYAPVGSVTTAAPGSLEYFLTERYCLFTVNDAFEAYRVDIHHPPWLLQLAEADIGVNTMAEAAGIRLPPIAPLLHFAKRQDVVAWLPARV